MGELGADLVGSSCDEMAFHEGKVACGCHSFVFGDGCLGAFYAFFGDEDFVLLGVFEELVLEAAFAVLHSSCDDGEVGLPYFPVTDEAFQHIGSGPVLSEEEDAFCVEVDAVDRDGRRFAFSFEVLIDSCKKGILFLSFRIKGQEPGGFHGRQKVFVFIQNDGLCIFLFFEYIGNDIISP